MPVLRFFMPGTATDGANKPIRFCSKTICEQEISVQKQNQNCYW